MYRTVVLFLLLICYLAAPDFSVAQELSAAKLSTVAVQSDELGVMLDFDMTELDLNVINDQNDESYTSFSIPGEGFTYDYGMPMLPMVSRFVIVPPNAGVELVVTSDEPEIIRANHPAVVCYDTSFAENAQLNAERFDGLYPPVYAEMSEPTVMRGVRLVKVTTYPVQYNPETNTYLHRNNIQTELRFDDSQPVNPAHHPQRRDLSREFIKFMDALAVNPEELHRDDAEMVSPYAGHYMIVANQNCVMPARDFIEWRRKSGYKVDIAAISNNDSRNTGRIKSTIQDKYDEYLDAGVDPFDFLMLIGDLNDHQSCGPNSNWILETESGESLWGNPPHADYKYALLEGNDFHLDVGIGRWASGNNNTMGLNVGRTLAYEAYPDMEDTDWFTRGGVGSQHWGNSVSSAWHITIHTNVRWGTEVLEQLGYNDVRFQERYEWDQQGQVYGPWVRDLLNEGCNVILSRAENYFWRSGFAGVNRNTVFPIRLNLSGHGEWTTWHMTRTGTGNDLKGPVASTCGWGGPPTAPMNSAWLNLVKGVMIHDLNFGWGYVFAVTNFENYFPDIRFNNQQVYRQIKTDTDSYGDPGIQPWRGVPLQYTMEHVEAISSQTRMIEVNVFDPEIEDPQEAVVEGARVTLYVPGELPDEWDDYANHDIFMTTTFTDENGVARFVFDDDPGFEEGTMYVTLTGRDILPRFGEIQIEEPEAAIDLAGYELNEVEGDEDAALSPGETFSINLTAANIGTGNAIENITAVVSSLSNWVVVEDNQLTFGSIDAGEESQAEESVVIHVDPSVPDGELWPSEKPRLLIEFASGELIWRSGITLDPVSPNFSILDIPGGLVIPDTLYELNIDVINIGRLNSTALEAELVSLGMGISVVESVVNFPPIQSGSHADIADNGFFLISGNSVVVPGSKSKMMLILTNADGFIDTTFFELQVREPLENGPQGPDKHGYLCFDHTDESWEISPEYDWIEISLEDGDRDFDGELLEFTGRSAENVGESLVIDLPFDTQFYGYLFDQITISTNGFICPGDQELITNFQNWPLDQAIGGGMGMIAPFWDWLSFGDDGGIYTFYDREDARFIVEWYNMRHREGGNSDLIFQVILYDNGVWITESGDQNILFQYNAISQARGPQEGGAWEKNVPYASVGISSVDGKTGLNYSFNDEYPVTSAPLESERAILYTTSPRYKACILYGTVTDYLTNAPVERAVVVTEHGFTAITAADGSWRINGALAEVPFDITARAQGYNDSTKYDFEVEEDDSLEINFELLHPEFSPSVWHLESMLDPGEETELEFRLENTGNGPMYWNVDRRLIGDANAQPWEFRRQYNAGAAVEDTRISGVIFANDHFYVSGGTARKIYVFNRDGELVNSFAQPDSVDRRGMRDLAWDGELIWGSVQDTIYGITPDSGRVVHQFESIYNPTVAMTWDTDREIFWVSSTTTNPVAYTREGELVDSLVIDRKELRIYGLAYWPDDPDHHPLYVLHKDRESGRQLVHKFDTATNDTLRVSFLDPPDGGDPQGAFITNKFDVYSWVMIMVTSASTDDGGDRIDIWQVDARKDWFQADIIADEERFEAQAGTLQTGEFNDFILTLNSTDLPETTFVSELYFIHNADSGRGHINIELDVIGPMPPFAYGLLEPQDGDTVTYGEVPFRWEEAIDPNADEDASYTLFLNAQEQEFQFETDIAEFNVDFRTLEISEDWLISNFTSWRVRAVSGTDTVYSNQQNNLIFRLPPRPPRVFDLVSPVNEAILDSTIVDFQWNASFDPNPDDVVSYTLYVNVNNDTLTMAAADTSFLVDFDTLDVNFDWMVGNNSTWWVNASSAEDMVESSEHYVFTFSELARVESWKNVPVEFNISAIFPNPFNSTATIRFGIDIPERSRLQVYDLSGRQVATLFDQTPSVGWHSVVWNAQMLPSGVYLVRLESAGRVKMAKTTLIK